MNIEITIFIIITSALTETTNDFGILIRTSWNLRFFRFTVIPNLEMIRINAQWCICFRFFVENFWFAIWYETKRNAFFQLFFDSSLFKRTKTSIFSNRIHYLNTKHWALRFEFWFEILILFVWWLPLKWNMSNFF